MNQNISILLENVIPFIVEWLDNVLPTLNNNWWNDLVVSSLSYRQKDQLAKIHSPSIKDLDLAALLRVLDYNWFQISQINNLPKTDRHYLKEMQSIRNKWAHLPANGYSLDDTYRDLDTLFRFSKMVKASDSFLATIQLEKRTLLFVTETENTKPELKFEKGDLVYQKSTPELKGVIIKEIDSKPENKYEVFINNQIQFLYESQIEKVEKSIDTTFYSKEELYAQLTSVQILHPSISNLYSLNASRIDYIPYQFRPVLKFIQSDRPRLLIADSVGVGKTIEAGLILRELQARHDINSVLIICPKALVIEKKWENEMKRFDEEFIPLDSRSLQYCLEETELEGFWPIQYNKAILSYSLFTEDLLYGNPQKRFKRKGLLDLEPSIKFDLIIVDEAHYIRNHSTIRHKIVRYFCDNAESVLFLTATPIQMGNQDLFTLLNVLRSDIVIDKKTFEIMVEPNKFINQCVQILRKNEIHWKNELKKTLLELIQTSWGKSVVSKSPLFLNIKNKLNKTEIEPIERIKLISEIEELHTLSNVINRTRRRDIGDFTIRKPKTIEINFTGSQRNFYDEFLNLQADIYSILHQNISLKFLMTSITRRATSCLYGLIPFLEEILTRNLSISILEENSEQDLEFNQEFIDIISANIKELISKLSFIDKYDPKLESLINILKEKKSLNNNKVMIFSSFRHTLSYLESNLKQMNLRIGVIHGSVKDDERVFIKSRFELPKEDINSIDVVLFSDVGAEGLDYQFCDCLINYDLPWNPMKIEQRIGRIDRNGQQSENIAIYNLITKNTIDADIYHRCLLRIGVFNSSIGENEEILGEIAEGIQNIGSDFSLTESERKKKLQQLSDNKIRLLTEQEKLEKKQYDLFGIRIPAEKINNDIKKATSYWLLKDSLLNLIQLYLQGLCGTDNEYILGKSESKTLRLSQEMRNLLLKDYEKITKKKSLIFRKWETWLKGNDQHLNITFEQKYAQKNRNITFITPLHPLIKQAANFIKNEERRIITILTLKDDTHIPRKYPFVIYSWQYKGIRNDMELVTVSDSDVISERIIDLLQKAKNTEIEEKNVFDNDKWDKIDEFHYAKWKKGCEEHRQKTKEIINYKIQSLKTSHNARISQLIEQRNNATNEKIIRMRKSQVEAAETDFARRLQELEIAIERIDISTKAVAYGVLIIE